MVRHPHPKLSLSRQCRLLSISRSSLYHTAKGESAQNSNTKEFLLFLIGFSYPGKSSCGLTRPTPLSRESPAL